ncbi:LPS export ABC transporter periplasmic protein LptC [Danxiaibacter flavus]|uniref:LPS export ABC transporter periplasmic protein LptC n=1 Tax=Danxiaibacter flavus TaxID=3049108 RepID=A0ABV3ZKE8_9BACT|nr:LPS export ABC transporter periplasmic protein LptC [Chitinophagaceae bacterium DXS]
MIQRFLRINKKWAILLPALLLFSCENKIEEVQDLGKKRTGVEEGVQIESYMSEGGVMKARLTAPEMLRTQNDTPRTIFPKSLQVIFYNDSLKMESHLFAKYGHYLQNDNKVFLRDSVVVFNVKGDTLFCDELWWDQNKQIFYSDKPVNVHKKSGENLRGAALTAKQDFSKYSFTNATGNLLVGDSLLPSNNDSTPPPPAQTPAPSPVQ